MRSTRYTLLPFLLLAGLGFFTPIAAQQVLFQGFENSANDNFTFVSTPAAYNNIPAEDVWSDTTATTQIAPATGLRQWFLRDLENPSGGGAFAHTLDFGPVDVAAFSNNTLTFKYYSVAYDSDDSLGYYVAFDNGLTWSNYTPLEKNTNAWTTVTVNAPAGAQWVRLRLAARQNGGSDFAAFDDVQLSSATGDVVPPLVTNASVASASSIQLVFSEALNATAEATANYTGLPNLTAATRSVSGDTVTLSLGTPLTNGQAYTLTVTDVQDLAGNPLATPFVFPLVFNGSTPNLVITEINYNPPSTDPDTLEFVEFYNFGTQPAAVGGLKVSGVIETTLPALTLQPGETVLIAQKKVAVEAFFPGQTFYQWTSGVLTNGGNTITLSNSLGAVIDQVVYDDAAPWPLEPDGQGPSLELLSPNLDNNDGANWRACPDTLTGTGIAANPGVVNTISLPILSFDKGNTLVTELADTVSITIKIDTVALALSEAKIRVSPFSTAVAGEDYLLLDTLVAFPAGALETTTIRVKILDNTTPRDARYLLLQLVDFVAATGGSVLEHNLLIADNDTPAPTPQASAPVRLSYLSSLRIDTIPGSVSAEISAYDPTSKRLFVTNIAQNALDVVNFSNPYAPQKVARIDVAALGGGINSVAVSNGVVAIAVDATPATDPGKVVLYDAATLAVLNTLTAGALPDHLSYTPDGQKLLVANEGEPSADYLTDPEGSVTLIDLSAGAAAATATQVTFAAFNADSAALRAAGVRIFGPNASVAQDLEPEFITTSDDGLTAYVTLQENNAIAVLDIAAATVTAIRPLGYKDWTATTADVSDNAPGIFFNSWPVKGMYQPDAIASIGNILVTANEGDVREYSTFNEALRVNASTLLLDPVKFPNASVLKRADLLGRLNVSRVDGDTDGDGDLDEIYTYGARSFSLWNASTGALLWDSGDDLERLTAADAKFGTLFNCSNSNNTRKNRSDDKGPEPEGVAVAEIEGRQYAFVALERIGGVVLYDITNPAAPEFVQYLNTRSTTAVTGDLGAEGIVFIPKEQSPNGRHLVVLSNEVSGTVSTFQVEIDKTLTGEFGLTKYAFDNTPAIGTTPSGLTLREGGISGLMYRDGQYRLISDRGPNADATTHPNANGAVALVFPFPDYAPKVWTVTPSADTLIVDDVDFVKRPGSTGVSGLPLPVGLGNTGEVAWLDTSAVVIPNDVWGLDSEGLAQDNEGNFWICDEYGASVWQLDANYQVLRRYTPFANQAEDLSIDSTFGKRRPNRGFEGVAYTPNGKVYAILQSPAQNPNAAVGNASRLHRILEIDPATGLFRTFVYEHDPVLGSIRSQDWKIGDLTAINNEEFLVLEHAERNGWNAKNVYKFSLTGATPVDTDNFGGLTLEALNNAANAAAAGIAVVQKTLFADLLELGWERQHDKPEGLAVVNDSTFAVINDNDFGIASPAADGQIVLTGKTTRLYVYTLPQDQHLNYVDPYCTVSLGADVADCGTVETTLDLSAQGYTSALWSDGDTSVVRTLNGAATFAVLATNEVGCRSRDTIVLTINALPVVDLGADQDVCPGTAATFVADNTGATYVWNTGATTPDISVSAAGTYAVTVTDANGCVGADTVSLSLNPVPTVNLGPNVLLCGTDVATFDAGNAGATFVWNNGATTQTIQATSIGNYVVTVTNGLGCTGTDAVAVTDIRPRPVVDLGPDSTICQNDTLQLSAGNPGLQYVWSTGSTAQTIGVSTTGAYTVTVTNVFGCSSTDSAVVTVEICSGTQQAVVLANARVFPNPTSGLLTVELSQVPTVVTHLRVQNAAGQRLVDEQHLDQLSTTVDLSQWPSGVYFLQLYTAKEVKTWRVVRQ